MLSGSEALFTAALGLSWPRQVADIRFEPKAEEIDFAIGCQSPRLSCPACSTTTRVAAPWAQPGNGFARLFAALVLTLAQAMPVAQVARRVGVSDARLWRVLQSIVGSARSKASFAGVSRIDVDEKHVSRQGFVSLVHDAGPARRVVFGTAGKDASAFETFAADLIAHGSDPHTIGAVPMDWSRAFKAGAVKHLPQALPCFDRFHLIKPANEALEAVRRAEVTTQPGRKGRRWGMLKDAQRGRRVQIDDMHWLTHSNRTAARDWRLKETLQASLETSMDGMVPEPAFKRWLFWARRCRLAPFKHLGAAVRGHLPGILNRCRLGLPNGTAESINAKVKAASARGRGFRTHSHLMAVIYLTCGKPTHLPTPCNCPISAA